MSFEQVLELAKRLQPADQARLVEQLAPAIVQALSQPRKTPRPSLFGALKHLGPAPSAEEIDEMRREAWANFPREDV
ncbi:MAG: hypothetical protein H7Y32_08860 [Chloroflexales bacterium]|nr:hypothetical protein [Chloroflexales bacterium]